MKRKLIISLLALAVAASAQAQISYTNGTYNQDFSSLTWTASEGTATWTDNSTITGWSIQANTNPTSYRAGAWSGTEASANLDATEVKALQILTSGTTGGGDRVWDGDTRLGARTGSGLSDTFFTMQLNNGSGGALNEFTVGYEAAQFMSRGTDGIIRAEYSFDNTNWTAITGGGGVNGTSSTVFTAVGSGTNENFNVTEINNSISAYSSTIAGVTWSDSSDLYVRFALYRDVPGGSSGNSPILAIDDVSFSAVPEPSAYGLIAGALALSWVMIRRRA